MYTHIPSHTPSLGSGPTDHLNEAHTLIFAVIVRWLYRCSASGKETSGKETSSLIDHRHRHHLLCACGSTSQTHPQQHDDNSSPRRVACDNCGSSQGHTTDSSSDNDANRDTIVKRLCGCPHIGLSFNGGKDCVVILSLLQSVVDSLFSIGSQVISSSTSSSVSQNGDICNSSHGERSISPHLFRKMLHLLASETRKVAAAAASTHTYHHSALYADDDTVVSLDEEVSATCAFLEELMSSLPATSRKEASSLPLHPPSEATGHEPHAIPSSPSYIATPLWKRCLERCCSEGRGSRNDDESVERSILGKLEVYDGSLDVVGGESARSEGVEGAPVPPSLVAVQQLLKEFISSHICVFYMNDPSEKDEQRDFRRLLLGYVMGCPRSASVEVRTEDAGNDDRGIVVRMIRRHPRTIPPQSLSSTFPSDGVMPSASSMRVDVMQHCMVVSVIAPKSTLGMGKGASYNNAQQEGLSPVCMKAALEAITFAFSTTDVLLGTRCEDPSARYQQHGIVDATSKGWPALCRVSPIFNWSYPQVWEYIFDRDIPFCPVYAHGYSSIGGKDTCGRNPYLLKVSIVSGVEKSSIPTVDGRVLASWRSWWKRRYQEGGGGMESVAEGSASNRTPHTLNSPPWSIQDVVRAVRLHNAYHCSLAVNGESERGTEKGSGTTDDGGGNQRGEEDGEYEVSDGGDDNEELLRLSDWQSLVNELLVQLTKPGSCYDPGTCTNIERDNEDGGTQTSPPQHSHWPGWVLQDGTLERAGRHLFLKK